MKQQFEKILDDHVSLYRRKSSKKQAVEGIYTILGHISKENPNDFELGGLIRHEFFHQKINHKQLELF